eukprot:CAMPEP_0116092090 /NCGR_PEP_ID=MMETSP0327-20121206/7852_1 /TAXON_ID=44447 /ORGANISM="Pseudo-nitzschia delicatissima, Strain B596" /LENGTH=422 /DNA_ID=CAMNT_0003583483 /DNA_START=35 /DNA_END=1303 /DNA_ORIENTATION=-
MSQEPDTAAVVTAGEEEPEEFKCYIGRVPTKFNDEIVKRNLVETLKTDSDDGDGSSVVQKVELIYPHDEEDGENANSNNNNNNKDGYRDDRMKNNEKDETDEKEHRGFGFVYFASAKYRDMALELGTIKGKRKPTSKKSHSMYLRPYVAKSEEDKDEEKTDNTTTTTTTTTIGRDVCHLWSLKRCPYGDECKFRHVGEGGCLLQEKDLSPEEQKKLQRKRKGKCFLYKKKGQCPKGDDCPFSHDFEPDELETTCKVVKADSQKDCINWKTKGKCRKGDKCPYKHDPQLQKRALEKKEQKKRLREGRATDDDDDDETAGDSKKRRREKQPLSVRVFGMNYATTETDIKDFIETTSGHPVQSVVFPRFEDSGRSKGYCGIYFASPKAAVAAVEKCDNAELHGRWLRVQTGKSMTIEAWEGLHKN